MYRQNFNNKFMRKDDKKGSIIVFTVLILGIILAISLTLAAIFIPKIQSGSDAENSVQAIFAAYSAIEWCIYINRGNAAVSPPIMSNGSTYTLSPSDCTIQPLNHDAVGTYRGVSRSFHVGIQ